MCIRDRGSIDDDYVYIIRSKFDQIMSEEGYNASAFLGWARNTGNIKVGKDGKPTIVKKINGHSCRLVAIKLNENDNIFEEYSDELLP